MEKSSKAQPFVSHLSCFEWTQWKNLARCSKVGELAMFQASLALRRSYGSLRLHKVELARESWISIHDGGGTRPQSPPQAKLKLRLTTIVMIDPIPALLPEALPADLSALDVPSMLSRNRQLYDLRRVPE